MPKKEVKRAFGATQKILVRRETIRTPQLVCENTPPWYSWEAEKLQIDNQPNCPHIAEVNHALHAYYMHTVRRDGSTGS